MSQELVNSVNKLTDETSALLQEYVKGNTVLQNSASEAASSAAAAKVSEGITIDKANVATQKAAEAKQFRDETAAVATGGTATFDPTPGKIPLADSEGKIHAGWLPVNVSALSEAIVEAIRDVNKEQYAASGFIHTGRAAVPNAAQNVINEGMWQYTGVGSENKLYLGRNAAVSSVGTSDTPHPVMNIAGFTVHLRNINNTDPHQSTVKFQESPNGAVVSDSSGNCRGSGKPTLDLSKEVDPKYGDVADSVNEAVARAFEGKITNGDFRQGDNGSWAKARVTINSSGVQFPGTTGAASAGKSGFVWPVATDMRAVISIEGATKGTLAIIQYGAGANDGNVKTFPGNAIETNGTHIVCWNTAELKDSFGADNTLYLYSSDGFDGRVTYFSLCEAAEEVVTERVDMAGLEFFKEKVGAYLYPYGMIQNKATADGGIATTEDTVRPITYFAVFEGDTTSRGRGWKLADLTFVQLATIMSNPEHNAWYNEAGELMQFRGRQRSFAGDGNGDWLNINPANNTSGEWHLTASTSSFGRVKPQGVLNSITASLAPQNVNESGMYLGNEAQSPNRTAGLHTLGTFTAVNKTINAPDTGVAVDGECYFYVLATVPRLNQGVYHPSFNPMGADKAANVAHTGSVFWYELGNETVTTLKTFLSRSAGGIGHSGSGWGSISSNVSGRPDGRLYDAIYASGQGGVIDWRLPARDMGGKEEANMVFQKVVNGSYLGIEKLVESKVMFANRSGVADFHPSYGLRINMALGLLPAGLKIPDVTRSKMYCHDTDTYFTVRQYFGAESGSDRIYVADEAGNKHTAMPEGILGAQMWSFIRAELTNISVSGNFTTLDVVAPPERVMATPDLANGWMGRLCPIIPDNTGKTFPASKKYLTVLGREFTTDGGSTWQRVPDWTGQGANVTLNAIATTALPPDRVTLNHYTAFAKQTKNSVNKPVLNGSDGIGDVWATSGYGRDIDWGVLLQESLTGKVGVSDKTDDLAYRFALTRFSIHSASLIIDNSVGRRASHNPLTLTAPTNNSPAVKTLWHQASNNQQATLNFLWNELVYKTTLPMVTDTGAQMVRKRGERYLVNVPASPLHNRVLCWEGNEGNVSVDYTSYYIDSCNVVRSKSNDARSTLQLFSGDGWGDDKTIRIVDGQSTYINLNGDTCLYGTDELAMPYGYTKNQAGAGKQVVGVDL
ncbi:hypothetical protein ACSTEP_10215 [Vibrio vulnificus]|uniref:hypothetical protein n=1 Tax=Vibrio vulnificus TaxID=672 RepID=UPI003ED8C971